MILFFIFSKIFSNFKLLYGCGKKNPENTPGNTVQNGKIVNLFWWTNLGYLAITEWVWACVIRTACIYMTVTRQQRIQWYWSLLILTHQENISNMWQERTLHSVPLRKMGEQIFWVMGGPIKFGFKWGVASPYGGLMEKQLSGRLHYLLWRNRKLSQKINEQE